MVKNSKKIDFGSALNFDEIVSLITASPDVRYCIVGEPGIGKSSMAAAIAAAASKMYGKQYGVAYIDVPTCDLGDIAMPVVNRDEQVTNYYPNARFGFHTGQPMVVMLDEFSKGVAPVQNMLHPLLEKANPRLGDVPVPEGSIIFMTGNLATDGVGDVLKAHTLNRVVRVRSKKPNSDEWNAWAIKNNIQPIVMAWVDQFPHALASYTDGDESNPYIYYPTKQQSAFVTPRSLETASQIIEARERAGGGHGALIAALTGAIGEAAARDMEAFIHFQDQLASWEDIVKNPKKAKVPEGAGATSVLIYRAILRVEPNTIDAWMTYLERLSEEWQATFCINLAKNKDRQTVGLNNPSFINWVTKNEDLL